jgi:hypothetical protein
MHDHRSHVLTAISDRNAEDERLTYAGQLDQRHLDLGRRHVGSARLDRRRPAAREPKMAVSSEVPGNSV